MLPEFDLFRTQSQYWPKKDKNLTFAGGMAKAPKIKDFLQLFKRFDNWKNTPYIQSGAGTFRDEDGVGIMDIKTIKNKELRPGYDYFVMLHSYENQ